MHPTVTIAGAGRLSNQDGEGLSYIHRIRHDFSVVLQFRAEICSVLSSADGLIEGQVRTDHDNQSVKHD